MTAVQIAVLLPVKSSSDDDSGFSYGFGAKTSLSLTQSAPAVPHDTTGLCFFVTLLERHIHADAVKALFWIFFISFLLSYGESPRLVRYPEVKLVMKPRYPTLIGNIFVIQPFLIHCSCKSLYFFQLTLMRPVDIFLKRILNSITKTSIKLKDQMKCMLMFQISCNVPVSATLKQWWHVTIFTRYFQIDSSVSVINRNFIDILTTPFCSIGNNLKNFIVSSHIVS